MYTSYTNVVLQGNYLGTCDDPQPITCEGRQPADACEACLIKMGACEAIVLCESDPNCRAIGSCFDYCGSDQPCADRCLQNADFRARDVFRWLKSLKEYCPDACQ
jgi:hypothetical protein